MEWLVALTLLAVRPANGVSCVDSDDAKDCAALVSVFQSLGNSEQMDGSVSVCRWEGVGCDEAGRVQQLFLFDDAPSGTIPSELGMLTLLTELCAPPPCLLYVAPQVSGSPCAPRAWWQGLIGRPIVEWHRPTRTRRAQHAGFHVRMPCATRALNKQTTALIWVSRMCLLTPAECVHLCVPAPQGSGAYFAEWDTPYTDRQAHVTG